uniref:E1 domain-containing protein n=1 Tax=Steinernema glaseri TaxID=37863 RepID=A0A1I7YN49_9BILA
MLRQLTFLLFLGLSATEFLDEIGPLLSPYSRFTVPLCNGSTYTWKRDKWERSVPDFPKELACERRKIANISATPFCKVTISVSAVEPLEVQVYSGEKVPVLAGFTTPEKWSNLTGEEISGNQSKIPVYECVESHPPMVHAPENCETNRLVGRGTCRTESFWRAKARKDCRVGPKSYKFTTQCGTNQYLEVEYVCCMNSKSLKAARLKGQQAEEAKVHHTALSLLKEFSMMHSRIQGVIDDENKKLQSVYKNTWRYEDENDVLLPLPPFSPVIRKYLLTWLEEKLPPMNTTMFDVGSRNTLLPLLVLNLQAVRVNKEPIMSRRSHWTRILTELHKMARERSHNLFKAAFFIATDEEQKKAMTNIRPHQMGDVSALKEYNVEEVVKRFETTNSLDLAVFPELKEQIVSTWIDYCIRYTWGIPTEDLKKIMQGPNAHSKIILKYHTIFGGLVGEEAEEIRDQDPNQIAETAVIAGVVIVTLLLVAMIFTGLIHYECCIVKVPKLSTVDNFVLFRRRIDEDRAALEME